MKRQRAKYASRQVWYVVAALSIVLVVGFATAGYEINHLRTEINGLHQQVANVNGTVSALFLAVLRLGQQLK